MALQQITFLDAIGIGAATLTMFSFVPQVIKIQRSRSAGDMSLVTLVQLSSGVFLWIIYGCFKNDPIIITANLVTLASLLAATVLYFKYRH